MFVQWDSEQESEESEQSESEDDFIEEKPKAKPSVAKSKGLGSKKIATKKVPKKKDEIEVSFLLSLSISSLNLLLIEAMKLFSTSFSGILINLRVKNQISPANPILRMILSRKSRKRNRSCQTSP